MTSLSVRAELVRAALHFASKGDEAKSHPERAGVRFEPSAAGGVTIIAMCETSAIVLLDRDGRISEPTTLRLPSSLFDAARREQRDQQIKGATAVLYVEMGAATLSGVTMPAPSIDLPFPGWRRLVKPRAHGAPPPISSRDLSRIASAAGILETLSDIEEPGVPITGAETADAALAMFDAWPDAFAVAAPTNSPHTFARHSFIWMLSGEGHTLQAAS